MVDQPADDAEELEEGPSGVPASIDAAMKRDGEVIWYRHNGQDFAVRADTAEHRHLVDSGARRLEKPPAAERAAPSPPRSARSTKTDRAK